MNPHLQMLKPQVLSRLHTPFGVNSNMGVNLGLRWVLICLGCKHQHKLYGTRVFRGRWAA